MFLEATGRCQAVETPLLWGPTELPAGRTRTTCAVEHWLQGRKAGRVGGKWAKLRVGRM